MKGTARMYTREMTIGETRIADDTPAYVIAEIGHNHEGDREKAAEMVRAAAAAGASAAKLQKRDNRSLFTQAAFDQPYTGRNSYGATYGLHREALEFGTEEYVYLAQVAKDAGIDFISTAFDFASVDFLCDLDIPAIKIASADLTNTPLLTYAAKTGKPIVMSTGGGDMVDVRRAVDSIANINENVALLQCTAVYPARPDQLNLGVLRSFRAEYPDVVVGYSGHDIENEAALVAFAMGARVVEKHFTLDRTSPGSDHNFSLEPAHLEDLVTGLDRVRGTIGDGVKFASEEEKPALKKMGKKLVAARPLPAGHLLTEQDIAIKSPGDSGLRPYHLERLIGRTTAVTLDIDNDLTYDCLIAP